MQDFYSRMIEKIDNFVEKNDKTFNDKTIWFIYRFLNEESKFGVLNQLIE